VFVTNDTHGARAGSGARSGSALQVEDDPELLDLMLADHAGAPERFQPTNYWRHRIGEIVAELRTGLHDFQARVGSLLETFGACDPPPTMMTNIVNIPPGDERAVAETVRMLNAYLASGAPALPYGISVEDLLKTGYLLCTHLVPQNSSIVPISRLTVSRAGNPYGFEVDGRFLTQSALAYYLRYAFVGSHLDLDHVDTIVELGSGGGKQVEVLKRLHPNVTFVLLDLPAQLYVAERYLHAALPRDVVPYRAMREPGPPSLIPGKIHFLSNARIADLADTGRTLFWNAASFGEMEPDIVEQYGADVSRFSDWLFLHQCFDGKERKSAEDLGGVLDPVRFAHYVRAFPDFRMVDKRPAHTGLAYLREGDSRYHDTFWARRAP
jgi:putative sugar O-methyltransferase